jgi:hypothetical protein
VFKDPCTLPYVPFGLINFVALSCVPACFTSPIKKLVASLPGTLFLKIATSWLSAIPSSGIAAFTSSRVGRAAGTGAGEAAREAVGVPASGVPWRDLRSFFCCCWEERTREVSVSLPEP